MISDGVTLGNLEDFPDGSATSVKFQQEGKEVALLVVRRGAAIVAYVDLCPHMYLPLTYRGTWVLSEHGTRLRCTNHAAEFSVSDGAVLSGPRNGCGLTPVRLDVNAVGTVTLAEVP